MSNLAIIRFLGKGPALLLLLTSIGLSTSMPTVVDVLNPGCLDFGLRLGERDRSVQVINSLKPEDTDAIQRAKGSDTFHREVTTALTKAAEGNICYNAVTTYGTFWSGIGTDSFSLEKKWWEGIVENGGCDSSLLRGALSELPRVLGTLTSTESEEKQESGKGSDLLCPWFADWNGQKSLTGLKYAWGVKTEKLDDEIFALAFCGLILKTFKESWERGGRKYPDWWDQENHGPKELTSPEKWASFFRDPRVVQGVAVQIPIKKDYGEGEAYGFSCARSERRTT